ncbi:tyrosine-type recombinase/integrase [Dactylosporangium darangshiense]|uniref:tyrosine-type recombinase/integrase n=1 Tax=Dactylosporangium darangshiense TaxID=579108 RepID=UPI0031EA7963
MDVRRGPAGRRGGPAHDAAGWLRHEGRGRDDAVRHRRLAFNAARYAAIPKPAAADLPCWIAFEAASFLRYCRDVGDPLTELFELLVATGMRKGEALGLHWADVDLAGRVLFVRHTLVAVDNRRVQFNHPKTPASRARIAVSKRAVAARGGVGTTVPAK